MPPPRGRSDEQEGVQWLPANVADITTHGLAAVGATLCEVRCNGVPIGRIKKQFARWSYQPKGWDGWTGDYRLMRDAVRDLADASL